MLVKASEQQATPKPAMSSDQNVLQKTQSPQATVRLPDRPQNSVVPELRLINKNVNLDIRIGDGAIVGRTTGEYVAHFGSFGQISGKHCQFSYDVEKGWQVIDLGSTNGTHISDQKIQPNTPHTLANQSLLKIANIEFFVKVLP